MADREKERDINEEKNAAALQQNDENGNNYGVSDQTAAPETFGKGEAEEVSSAEGQAEAMPNLNAERGEKRNFSARMGDADYVTGRRYDAVKNAFLSYRPQEKRGKPLKARITSGGETFASGRKLLAKLCLVGGYLRLYFALNPKAYSWQKYHHKDFSEVARYAKTPLMIKLSSDRQEKHALELIGEVMRANGYEINPDYIPEDRADIFRLPPSKRRVRTKIVYVDRPVQGEAAAADGTEYFAPPPAVTAAPAAPENPAEVDVKLPRRAKVTDREGVRVGKIRRSVWYDEEENAQGEFRKEERNVFLYAEDARKAYIDGNDNVLSLSDGYMATIHRFRWIPFIAVLLVILALLTGLSVMLGLYFTSQSGNPYAPTIFIADEDGKQWSDSENLPVFVNETFGDAVIMPGLKGSYRFTLENRNADALEFSLQFSEESNEYGIEIVYKLKRDGVYIGGGEYVGAARLGLSEMTIEAESATVFELEWFWQDNDAADTAAGENGAVYTLRIDFEASVLIE